MNILKSALVIARRDFVSIVATPTFIVFLLAPLLMLGLGAVGGASGASLAEISESSDKMVAIVPAAEVDAYRTADVRMRAVAGRIPQLTVLPADDAHQTALSDYQRDANVLAILTGAAATPAIAQRVDGAYTGRYLAALADVVAREGVVAADAPPASRPAFTVIATPSGPARGAQTGLGYGAVFAIFLLTLLLAGQTVGMLAEEKGNKVIEIMAAAVPLEGVFFGKLIGMLGVALLFIGFWGAIIGAGALAVAGQMQDATATIATFTPAIGWPLFALFGLLYFLSAFLLLGAIFLGVGAQASTVREIQMLSLPITIFQFAMFALASAAANAPDSGIATLARIIPWSSPFAMAARGATDAALTPHLMALGWQALWIAITIWVAVRLFRVGVLRSGWRWGRLASPAADPS